MEEDDSDYIPDGWYDPEYGPLNDPEESEIFSTTLDASAIVEMRRPAVVVRNNVSMHREPNTDSRTIQTLSANTNIRITGRLGDMYRIRRSGTTGWVLRTNLVQTRQTAVVRRNNVTVRASASSSARSLTTVNRGERLTITHQNRTGRWSRVTVNGRTGWIRSNQLAITHGRRPGRTSRAVQLHSRPDSRSTVRRHLPADHELMILQRTASGSGAHHGWTQVQIRHSGGTQIGWIRTNRVTRGNHSRRIRGNSVPFRTGPGSNHNRHSRVRSISNNTRVRVLAEISGWSHIRVRVNGRDEFGWVATNRLTRINAHRTTLSTSESLSYLALVNQHFRLSSSFSPNDMRTINVRSTNGNHRMRSTAAREAENMFAEARAAGHELIATSGYRSYATQRATHNHWISVLGATQARRVSARPGHSEHQLGLALDLSTPSLGGALSSNFSSTPEGRWVRNNAHRFGFIIRYPRNREADTGFAYEPWHIRYVGVDAATDIFNNNLILEEYLGY